jgi:hypothetical protein
MVEIGEQRTRENPQLQYTSSLVTVGSSVTSNNIFFKVAFNLLKNEDRKVFIFTKSHSLIKAWVGLIVSLPREWFQEIKHMMTVYSTHGLFLTCTQELVYI